MAMSTTARRKTIPPVIETVDQLAAALLTAKRHGKVIVLIGRDDEPVVQPHPRYGWPHPDAYRFMIDKCGPYRVYQPATRRVHVDAMQPAPEPAEEQWTQW